MAAAAARAPGRRGDGNAAEAAAAVPEAVAGHVKVGSLLSTRHCAELLGLLDSSTALKRHTYNHAASCIARCVYWLIIDHKVHGVRCAEEKHGQARSVPCFLSSQLEAIMKPSSL